MEVDNSVSLVSYNVLFNDTFDFPIDEKTGNLDRGFEYKWKVDVVSSDKNKVMMELKPDLKAVPAHIAIKKLEELAEELKKEVNTSALITKIKSNLSYLSDVNFEEAFLDDSTISLKMNLLVENEVKELEQLRQVTLDGVLELFPFMNIMNVQLKYFFESLKKDFGEETKTKSGNTIWKGIPMPLEKTMTPEEVTKLEKYSEMINGQKRYKRVEEKLSIEIKKDGKSKPIMFLTEVSRKWANSFKTFFAKQNYDSLFAPGVNPAQDTMGQMLAYPKDEYDLLNHTVVVEADALQHHPLEGFQCPTIDFIENHLHGQDKTSVGELTIPEIKQVFEVILNNDKKPILWAHFRKRNPLSSGKFNSFIAGSYHMPMRVGKQMSTVDPSSGEEVQKDVGRYVMGVHCYAARAKFEAFVNKMVELQTEKGLDGEGLRDRVVFMGDMNSVPPKAGFKFCSSRPGEEEWIEHRMRYFLDGSSATQDERLSDENELNKMLFLYNKDLKQSLDLFPAEIFPPLDHAHKKMFGEFAERTTRTEEFEGALDHIFASGKAAIKHVAKMPTTEELRDAGRFFPSSPMDQDSLLEDEPSDHLLQRAIFDFGIEI